MTEINPPPTRATSIIIPPRTTKFILLGLMLFSFLSGLNGIQKHLPYVYEADEPSKVLSAATIASSGNLNPGWFGHPGSTSIYPMAFSFHTWHAVTQNGTFFHTDPNLINHFRNNSSEYYYLGRLLSILYLVFAIPFIYGIGRMVFNNIVAISGIIVLILSPLLWQYAQVARADTASVFWGMAALFMCIHTYEKSKWSNFLISGFLIGVGIGSRYLILAVVPVYLLMVAAKVWEERNGRFWKSTLHYGLSGLIIVFIGFAFSTPYFFLDFDTALQDLTKESRSGHLGADGLSPIGNLWWYLTNAFPEALTWPVTILASIGTLFIKIKREIKQLLLLAYLAVFLFGICILSLHWARWLIPILPIFALFAAYALYQLTILLQNHWHWTRKRTRYVYLSLFAILLLQPMYKLSLYSIRQQNEPTRIEARNWIEENISIDNKIVRETYTPPLSGLPYEKDHHYSLSSKTLETYKAEDVDYLIVSSQIYERYYAEPERYAKQVAFYDSLATQTTVIKKFKRGYWQDGPEILIYQLSD